MPDVDELASFASVVESHHSFDITAPLTDEELRYAGLFTEPVERPQEGNVITPILKDLDEPDDVPVDVVAATVNAGSYNTRYLHYLACQALASLVAFDIGWKAFQDLVLKPYLSMRRRDDANYRGDDPNKAFSLRVRRQEAEDFVKFISAMITEAIQTPKPVLTAQK